MRSDMLVRNAGRGHCRLEALSHRLDRLVVPLDHSMLRKPQPVPSPQVSQKPGDQPDRRLALFSLAGALRAPVEYTPLDIDVASTNSRLERRPADSGMAGAGVEPHEKETGNMFTHVTMSVGLGNGGL